MQATHAPVDPSIASCPHFGFGWKSKPEGIPKHIRCLAVIHHFATGSNSVSQVQADQYIEGYLNRFGVRSTTRHEIQTLIYKGLIRMEGDDYVFEAQKVGDLLANYMQPCRG